MSDTYQIVGECAYVTANTTAGRTRVLMYKGALVPADAPELKHLLDSGLVAKVSSDETGGVNADGVTVAEASGEVTTTDTGSRALTTPHTEADETEARRAAARAKLPADGSPPKASHGEDVWIEYAVIQGVDRIEAEKAGKDELRKLLVK